MIGSGGRAGAAVLAAICLLAFAWAPGARAQCPVPPNFRQPRVSLQVMEPQLKYRHDVDLLGLSRIQSTYERAPKGWVMLGVTIRKDMLAIDRASIQYVRLPDRRYCVWVDEVRARLGDPLMDVFVASNYPVGSCEYNVVLEHENTHVAINRSVIRAYVPRIEASLREAAARRFPIIVSDINRNQTNAILNAAMRPLIDQMEEELRRRNGAIDTPEAYRRTTARCGNWFPPGTRLPAH